MECSICFERFDSTERLPKVLGCGHTFCLKCLEKPSLKQCPLDQTELPDDPQKFLTNYFVADMIRREASPKTVAPRRFWCRDCGNMATDSCMDGHTVTAASAALRSALLPAAKRVALQAEVLKDIQKLPEGRAVRAMQVLLGPAASCTLAFQDKHRKWQTDLELAAASEAGAQVDLRRYYLYALLSNTGVDSDPPQFDQLAVDEVVDALGEDVDLARMTNAQIETLAASSKLKEVRRLKGVRGSMPCCLQLLQGVAPHLEELQLHYVDRLQLQVVLTMPRLVRLELWNCSEDLWRYPFSLAPEEEQEAMTDKQKQQRDVQQQLQQLKSQLEKQWSSAQVSQVQALEQQLQKELQQQELAERLQQRVQWLRIGHLPYGFTMSYIYSQRSTLEELWLLAGTGGPIDNWPYTSGPKGGLDVLHKLKVIKRVVFLRQGVVHKKSCDEYCKVNQTNNVCSSPPEQCCHSWSYVNNKGVKGDSKYQCEYCTPGVLVPPF